MRLVHKLFLLLSAAALLPLALGGAAVAWRSTADQRELLGRVTESWGRASRVGGEAVARQAWLGHRQLVSGKAAELERDFESFRRAVQLDGLLLERALAAPPPESPGIAAAEWRAPDADPASVEPVRRALRSLLPVYAHHQKALPWSRSSFAWHRSGVLIAHPPGRPFPPSYDPLKTYWYLKAADKQRIIWTKMYLDEDGEIVITYAQPVAGPDGIPLAVAGTHIRIEKLLGRLFDLGGLPVVDAVLLDYKGRVRASAGTGGRAELNLKSLLTDIPPYVSKFRGGVFVPVHRAIVASGAGSGVVDGAGRDAGDPASEGDLFTYARLKVLMADGDAMDWYYVVRVPRDPLIKPMGEMGAALAALEGELSASLAERLRRRAAELAAAGAGVLLLAGLLAVWAARAGARPLARAAEAVTRIAAGDFDQRLEITSSDEIGELERAVNEMAAELKKGLLVKGAFKRYVAPSVVDQLLKNPDAVRLGGERRVMTALFSDLSGFTTLSEKMEPEALVELINEYLSAMTLCVFAREGTVDKYEGDAMVAFWGAPLEQPDHASRAVLAALDAFDALAALDRKWRAAGLPELSMRIGVNTGPMIVGNMGSMVKMDYTAMGDAMNLASRLEGANRAYGTRVLAGEQTWEQARAAVEWREVDRIAVKGKTRATRVFEAVAKKGALGAERLAALRAYEAGLTAYRARRWDEAEARWREADAAAGGDAPSKVMLARLPALKAAPPAEGWDGVFTLTTK